MSETREQADHSFQFRMAQGTRMRSGLTSSALFLLLGNIAITYMIGTKSFAILPLAVLILFVNVMGGLGVDGALKDASALRSDMSIQERSMNIGTNIVQTPLAMFRILVALFALALIATEIYSVL